MHKLNLLAQLLNFQVCFVTLFLNFINSFSKHFDERLVSLLFGVLELKLLVLIHQEHESCFKVFSVIMQHFIIKVEVVNKISDKKKIICFKWRELSNLRWLWVSLDTSLSQIFELCLGFSLNGNFQYGISLSYSVVGQIDRLYLLMNLT